MSKKKMRMQARTFKAPVEKALHETQIQGGHANDSVQFVQHDVDLRGLKRCVDHSSILPQCIRAYRNNIAGFGIGIRYKEDYDKKTGEPPEWKAEFDRAQEALMALNADMDLKELFEDVVEVRETYGIAYVEVMRNEAGDIVEIELIRETPTIVKTRPLPPYIDTEYWIDGKVQVRPKRYRKYKQQLDGKTVYFKEIGDRRNMDKNTGEYEGAPGVDFVEVEDQANEILELSIGTDTYGQVRWIGQLLGIDGSRRAEELNNNYFENGRHTPLMIMVKGGTLTQQAHENLQQHMNGIKGEAGQHSFLLLEAETIGNRADYADDKPPDVDVKDLAPMLQRDELFQTYIDNNRRRVQSAFLLPDVYVGYTTDFNRATAQTAQEITEMQVFEPERISLAWAINNKLLSDYRFEHVEAYFKGPVISNPDDVMKILSITERAGGLTPNKAKELTLGTLGEESEDYDDTWGNIPFTAYGKVPEFTPQQPAAPVEFAKEESNELLSTMKQIRKMLRAEQGGDTDETAS